MVIVIDGHQPNNRMVAFWRDEIPSDWAGLPGLRPPASAAVTPLPYATAQGDGFNIENSPTAWGYEIATAQWNGIGPTEDPRPRRPEAPLGPPAAGRWTWSGRPTPSPSTIS